MHRSSSLEWVVRNLVAGDPFTWHVITRPLDALGVGENILS